jgi:hypothetical protein
MSKPGSTQLPAYTEYATNRAPPEPLAYQIRWRRRRYDYFCGDWTHSWHEESGVTASPSLLRSSLLSGR